MAVRMWRCGKVMILIGGLDPRSKYDVALQLIYTLQKCFSFLLLVYTYMEIVYVMLKNDRLSRMGAVRSSTQKCNCSQKIKNFQKNLNFSCSKNRPDTSSIINIHSLGTRNKILHIIHLQKNSSLLITLENTTISRSVILAGEKFFENFLKIVSNTNSYDVATKTNVFWLF